MICYYDLAKNPPTYDFVTFLVRCEALRSDLNKESVEIVVLPGPANGFRKEAVTPTWPARPENRRELLNHVVVPMTHLLPTCRSITVSVDRPAAGIAGFGLEEYTIPFSYFAACYARGIRPLRFPTPQPRDEKLITITLREAEHHPQRNSKVEEWRKAALLLIDRGYRVIVVRDTLRADVALGDIPIDPIASRSLIDRARLYSSAAVNLFVNNGPAWLCVAMDLPTMIFKSDMAVAGVIPPAQLPNAPAHQRLVWEEAKSERVADFAVEFLEGR
jgi:hypothetical protein